eukprot:15346483-Ditylum_brightwellii.AAC.1
MMLNCFFGATYDRPSTSLFDASAFLTDNAFFAATNVDVPGTPFLTTVNETVALMAFLIFSSLKSFKMNALGVCSSASSSFFLLSNYIFLYIVSAIALTYLLLLLLDVCL